MLEERAVKGLHDALAAELTSMPRNTPVIDLGCGSGAWVQRLRAMGFTDVTGADLHPPTGFIRANIEDRLDLDPDRRYGLVTAIEVIEHLGAPGRLLENAAALMAPEGRLLLTTPNIHSLRARTRFLLTGRLPSFDDKGDPTHVSPINVFGLQRMAERHGLFIERSWTYPERGTHIFGPATRFIAALMSPFAPNALPGDNLCVVIRARQSASSTRSR